MPMVIRVRFQTAGGHVHCRVFMASGHGRTFAKCGDLCVQRGPEFQALQNALRTTVGQPVTPCDVEWLPDTLYEPSPVNIEKALQEARTA